jgi:regulatory protein
MPHRKQSHQLNDENALYDYSVRALARRMHSVAELKRKLRTRCSDEAVTENVIQRLKDQKYLNDSSYAATYSAFRRDNEKFGRRRVVTDLKVRGIHPDVITRAVDETYREVNESDLARAFLKRKRLRKPESNREAARVFRALLRAGFGMATAVQVLKSWDVEDEVVTALQEEAES